MSGRDDFIAAREAIMARKREELGEPPTPEELLAYRDSRLDPAAREVLEAKLAVYPEAARALADLAAFPEIAPEPDTPELSEPEMDASWEAFRRRLEKLPRPAPPAVVPVATGRPVFWQLAATAILCLSIGQLIGYTLGRASRTAQESGMSPALNVVTAELEPFGGDGARAPAAAVELPEGSDELLLILIQPGTESFSGYAAEILDREGTRLWSGDGLRPTPEGTFRMSFPREAFAPGVYRIHLFGQGRAEGKLLASYELRVALTPGPSPASGRGVKSP